MESIITYLLIAWFAFLLIEKVLSARRFKNYESYLLKKKMSMNPEKYSKFLNRETAEINSLIKMRELKGFVSDPLHTKALENIEDQKRKIV